MVIPIIFAALAILSLLLNVWQWLATRNFPLHQRESENPFSPPVSLLKPLKGCDPETRRCLQSWFRQDYPGEVQILFGVASEQDPVCELVRQLIAENPQSDAQLVIDGTLLGANAKVSTLVQLERKSRHEILIISDADVAVPTDFLTNIVSPLQNSDTGLVNCFYRLANPTTLAMHWEAIAINADFWSQVLQAKTLKPLDFALGAVMATTRVQLQNIGGFASFVNFLADDYQLGNRIAGNGKKIVLSPVVVDCWERVMNFSEVFRHQLRWARTIRICQSLPYFFSILSNATLWAALLLAVYPSAWCIALICLLARIATALSNQKRINRVTPNFLRCWLIPAKDVLNALIWALAFVGNNVEWRGQKYRVEKNGELIPRI